MTVVSLEQPCAVVYGMTAAGSIFCRRSVAPTALQMQCITDVDAFWVMYQMLIYLAVQPWLLKQ
jgi:hypothetical protein